MVIIKAVHVFFKDKKKNEPARNQRERWTFQSKREEDCWKWTFSRNSILALESDIFAVKNEKAVNMECILLKR